MKKRGVLLALVVLIIAVGIPPVHSQLSPDGGCFTEPSYPNICNEITQDEVDTFCRADSSCQSYFYPATSCSDIPECQSITGYCTDIDEPDTTYCQQAALKAECSVREGFVAGTELPDQCQTGCCILSKEGADNIDIFGKTYDRCIAETESYPGYSVGAFDKTITTASACADLAQETIQRAALSGTVANSTGSAIDGVMVSAGGKSANTNSTGEFTLTDLPVGEVLVTAGKTGYLTNSTRITLTAGDNTLDIALSEISLIDITGYIKDSDDEIIEGAAVRLKSGGKVLKASSSDSSGYYGFNNLEDKSYEITASKFGYDENTTEYDPLKNTNNITLTLNKAIIKIITKDKVSGEAVTGVTISFNGSHKGITDSSGELIIAVDPGKYNITTRRRGYLKEEIVEEYNIGDNTSTPLEIDLNPERVCLERDYARGVNNIRAVQGSEPSVTLTWEDNCKGDIRAYMIYRYDGSVTRFFYTPNTLYFDMDTEWGNTYAYNITPLYKLYKETAVVPKSRNITISMGDPACEGLGGKTFCSNDKTKVLRCDGNNEKAVIDGCSNKGTFCKVNSSDPDNAFCDTTEGLSIENCPLTGPFGIFSTKDSCEAKGNFCYMDRGMTIVDSCRSCVNVRSCFDYNSRSACENDDNTCSVGDCEWKPSESVVDTGGGYCVETDYSDTGKTDMCGLCNSENFPFRNTRCTENICSSLGSCTSNADETACIPMPDNFVRTSVDISLPVNLEDHIAEFTFTSAGAFTPVKLYYCIKPEGGGCNAEDYNGTDYIANGAEANLSEALSGIISATKWYNLSFFTEYRDSDGNLINESVRSKKFLADITPPYITLKISKEESEISSNLSIDINLTEPSKCSDNLEYLDSGVPSLSQLNSSKFDTLFRLDYENLVDGYWIYGVECTDDLGNSQAKEEKIFIDGVKGVARVSPPEVVSDNKVRFAVTTMDRATDCTVTTDGNDITLASDNGFDFISDEITFSKERVDAEVECSFEKGTKDSADISFTIDKRYPLTTAVLRDNGGSIYTKNRFQWQEEIFRKGNITLECNDKPDKGYGCKETKYCTAAYKNSCEPKSKYVKPIIITSNKSICYSSTDNGSIEEPVHCSDIGVTKISQLSMIFPKYGGSNLTEFNLTLRSTIPMSDCRFGGRKDFNYNTTSPLNRFTTSDDSLTHTIENFPSKNPNIAFKKSGDKYRMYIKCSETESGKIMEDPKEILLEYTTRPPNLKAAAARYPDYTGRYNDTISSRYLYLIAETDQESICRYKIEGTEGKFPNYGEKYEDAKFATKDAAKVDIFSLGLDEGEHTAEIDCTNRAGISNSTTAIFNVNFSLPDEIISSEAAAPGKIIERDSQGKIFMGENTFNFRTWTSNDAYCHYTLDGEEIRPDTYDGIVHTLPLSDMEEGGYIINTTCEFSGTGNILNDVTDLIVDLTPPSVIKVREICSDNITDEIKIVDKMLSRYSYNISGTEIEGSKDLSALGIASVGVNSDTGLKINKEYTLTVNATDRAGNENVIGITFKVYNSSEDKELCQAGSESPGIYFSPESEYIPEGKRVHIYCDSNESQCNKLAYNIAKTEGRCVNGIAEGTEVLNEDPENQPLTLTVDVNQNKYYLCVKAWDYNNNTAIRSKEVSFDEDEDGISDLFDACPLTDRPVTNLLDELKVDDIFIGEEEAAASGLDIAGCSLSQLYSGMISLEKPRFGYNKDSAVDLSVSPQIIGSKLYDCRYYETRFPDYDSITDGSLILDPADTESDTKDKDEFPYASEDGFNMVLSCKIRIPVRDISVYEEEGYAILPNSSKIINDNIVEFITSPVKYTIGYDNSPPNIKEYSFIGDNIMYEDGKPIVLFGPAAKVEVITDDESYCMIGEDTPLFREDIKSGLTYDDFSRKNIIDTSYLGNSDGIKDLKLRCLNRAELNSDIINISLMINRSRSGAITSIRPVNIATQNRSIDITALTSKPAASCDYTSSSETGFMKSTDNFQKHTLNLTELEDGSYTYKVSCGFIKGSSSREVTFIIDNEPPVMTNVSVREPVCSFKKIRPKFEAEDNLSGIARYEYFLLDSEDNVLAADNTSSDNPKITDLDLEENQTYTIIAKVYDAAGNAGEDAESNPFTPIPPSDIRCRDRFAPNVKVNLTERPKEISVKLECFDDTGCDKLLYGIGEDKESCDANSTYESSIPVSASVNLCYFAVDVTGKSFSGNKFINFTDSDNDGVLDSFDRCSATQEGSSVDDNGCPLIRDTDGDGLPDEYESRYSSIHCPLDKDKADSDGDGVDDGEGDCDLDGLTNLDAYDSGLTPYNPDDTDSDGIPDYWEDANKLDKSNNIDSNLDPDKDGMINLDEYLYETDPNNPDTDSDGWSDGAERTSSTDPLDLSSYPEDTDSDGIGDGFELKYCDGDCNPVSDSDNDRLTDKEEYIYGLDPTSADTDSDGMDDGWEINNSLNPYSDDSAADYDLDSLENVKEFAAGTNPLNQDTDSDGMDDGWEVENRLNPLLDDSAADPDNDGLTDIEEYSTDLKFGSKTDPLKADSDGDGWNDGAEVKSDRSPVDPLDKPRHTAIIIISLLLSAVLIGGGVYYLMLLYKKKLPLLQRKRTIYYPQKGSTGRKSAAGTPIRPRRTERGIKKGIGKAMKDISRRRLLRPFIEEGFEGISKAVSKPSEKRSIKELRDRFNEQKKKIAPKLSSEELDVFKQLDYLSKREAYVGEKKKAEVFQRVDQIISKHSKGVFSKLTDIIKK